MDDFKDMDIFEKERRLHEELETTIERFSMEYDLTYSQIIGIVTIVQQSLIREFLTCDNDEDSENTDYD